MRNIERIFFARSADLHNFNAQAKNTQAILRHWRNREVRPSVVAFGEPDSAVASNPNVEVISLRNDRWWRLAFFTTYLRSFDAIFYPGLHHRVDWLALRTRALTGRKIPIIATLEGLLALEGDNLREQRFSQVAGHTVFSQQVNSSRLRRMEGVYSMADHIIAISPFLGHQAAALYGNKVSVLPLGVDLELWRTPKKLGASARLEVICAGGVNKWKRPDVFVSLAARFPQADFRWFGEGQERAALQHEIANRGLRNIEFAGAVQPDVLARQFSGADILVLPSLSEGVPKVTQEAAAAGLAQIVFGFYEAPTVVDGRNGFVVWNDDELFARLGQLLSDPALAKRMGEVGKIMAADWNWDVIAPRWEARILEVLEDCRTTVGTGA
ncbi:MAG: glycosyltransferase family 4 protein [Proteobacteria bacterium]|nr:glycosyltransferase family 4 protein [Pseudomonadota bacterium]